VILMAGSIHIDLSRGSCPVHTFGPQDQEPAPIVIVFMDAFGPRPALFRIAERLAGEGYRVLVPDLFYAHLPYRPLDPKSLFSGGEDRNRLMTMLGALDQAAVDSDVRGLLEACANTWGAVPVGAVGYCMGGRFALTAATVSERVVAAASLHASMLAPAEGDSPHRHFASVRSSVYIGVAGVDASFGAEEEGRLATALRAAGVNHTIETYAGAAHGFVMDDLPVHDARAAERHWIRISTQLREAFAR